jgi:hypothetical protein
MPSVGRSTAAETSPAGTARSAGRCPARTHSFDPTFRTAAQHDGSRVIGALSREVTVLRELIEAGRALEPIESPHNLDTR